MVVVVQGRAEGVMLSGLPTRVDQGEALPCEEGQVELTFKFSRIIENLTWTI